MTGLIMVYVPCPDILLARMIAEQAIEKRLAACANILPAMQSFYHWQGRVETADEVMLSFKTTATQFVALAAFIRALHSYELPAINAIAIDNTTPDFKEWLLGWIGA